MATAHAFINALLSWVLVEASLWRFEKIPFTCSYLPGRANLPYTAGLYFGIFATYSSAMAAIGFHALTTPRHGPLIQLVAALVALALTLAWHKRQRVVHREPIVFEDEPEALLRLDLTR